MWYVTPLCYISSLLVLLLPILVVVEAVDHVHLLPLLLAFLLLQMWTPAQKSVNLKSFTNLTRIWNKKNDTTFAFFKIVRFIWKLVFLSRSNQSLMLDITEFQFKLFDSSSKKWKWHWFSQPTKPNLIVWYIRKSRDVVFCSNFTTVFTILWWWTHISQSSIFDNVLHFTIFCLCFTVFPSCQWRHSTFLQNSKTARNWKGKEKYDIFVDWYFALMWHILIFWFDVTYFSILIWCDLNDQLIWFSTSKYRPKIWCDSHKLSKN